MGMNVDQTITSEEETSNDEQMVDQESELNSEEEIPRDERQMIDQESELDSEAEVPNDEEEVVDQESELDNEKDNVDNLEVNKIGLDASATESDEDDSEIDDNFEDNKQKEVKSKSEKIKQQILNRYQEKQGKQLYIRFPHKVPETQEELYQKVKELVPLAVKAHKPRQRHARFCLIDFATKEDRDASLNMLKKSIKKGDLIKFAARIPRTESSDFVQELTERKIMSLENKKAKQRLKRATKNALKENNFTSTVLVLNLPKNTSTLQIRELFVNAVDINIKPCKGKANKNTSIAAVTLPTTIDARNATKQKLSLGGNKLNIKFDNKKLSKKTKCKNIPKNNEISEQSEPATKRQKLEKTLDNTRGKIPTKLEKTLDNTRGKIPTKAPSQKTKLKKCNNAISKNAKFEGINIKYNKKMTKKTKCTNVPKTNEISEPQIPTKAPAQKKELKNSKKCNAFKRKA